MMESVKPKPFQGMPNPQGAIGAQRSVDTRVDTGVDTGFDTGFETGVGVGAIPEVSYADINACLRRSSAARGANDDILKSVANGSERLHRKDLESMLARAGLEQTDVKTVLAYHAAHTPHAFDAGALKFLHTLDWSDVSAAHVDELKRQNQEQVESHQTFIKDDKRDFDALKSDDARKLQKTNDEKGRLQKKSTFEIEGDFADEASKSSLNKKEAFLLLAHRKRFAKD